MTLRNLRAYTPGTNETTGVQPGAYDTGSGSGILRKINLNVDIATQNELNEAFQMLSAAISSTQGDLGNYYTKSEVNAISTALSDTAAADIAAEASARQEADEAITASLSAYALSTTVADAYKVTVANPTEIEGDKLRYEVLQGGEHAGYLDIAKDQFVSAAAFDGTVLTLTLRDGTKISTDLGDLADYSGVDGENATVDIDSNHQISVYVKDYASKTYVDGVSAEVSAAAAADIAAAEAAANAYTDEVSTALSNAFEPRVADNETVSEFVREMSATWGGGGTAIQSVDGDDVYIAATTNEDHEVTVAATADLCAAVANANSALQTISKGTDGTFVTTTVGTKENNDQTVAVAVTVADLSAETEGLAEATDVKAYVDAAVAGKNVDAEGDAIVEATASENKITVKASDALCAVVDKVQTTSAAWDDAVAVAGVVKSTSATWDEVSAKADLTAVNELTSALSDAITAETERATAAEEALSNEVAGLSAVYKTIAKVNNAVSSTRFDLPITDDYEDIDDIIADVLEIRKALNMLRETNSPAPVTGDFIKVEFDYSSGWDSDVGGHHVTEVVYSMNSDHTIKEQVSITKDCPQDTVTILGNTTYEGSPATEIEYMLWNVNEGSEASTQSFIIVYNPESGEYDAAWGTGPSSLEQPTVTKLTSV